MRLEACTVEKEKERTSALRIEFSYITGFPSTLRSNSELVPPPRARFFLLFNAF